MTISQKDKKKSQNEILYHFETTQTYYFLTYKNYFLIHKKDYAKHLQ
ncbi:TPA: 3-methyladenine DNA glycosylase [Clostridioides difficile]|nr:3-methyladenine DNA glycosylase [Clostridioides difficile]CCK88606.1 3-methyladenine DNA glycosylase [Clostridioides difficile T5]CCK92042.1 3-methyladenine DNA glycosylase [Clostridioides difficile T20]SHO39099.1 3-methyladenine DNA glycosylase 3596147:3596299 forward MW:6304 [Clostridioides difficile M120]AVD39526.1 3-methyladenine DNA glycosylase [Clostridioides difficile]